MLILVLYDPQHVHDAQLLVLNDFEQVVAFIRTHEAIHVGWRYHTLDTALPSTKREFSCPVYS